ncbi:MAG: amidohydrolase [Turicibacter sp.]|nr:amidohydrolase [Turicibacter sp.]
MDLIFKNIATLRNGIFETMNVGVKNGKIHFVEDTEQAMRFIDGTNKALIPGLYNCHVHTPMSLLRGFANDLALEAWLFDYIFPAEERIKNTPNAIYVGAMLSIAEMLASGTIAFSEMYFGLPDIARAAEESGVIADLSNAVISFDSNGYDYSKNIECQETLRILQEYHNAPHGRIKAVASLHCAYTTHPEAWRQVSEFAKKHEISMHVHLSESVHEHNKCIEMFGKTPTQVFAEYGVFDVPTIAAHACQVTDEDMQLLKKFDVTVAHNPVSNLKLASGIAPIAEMRARGLNVVIGTDGMASNNSHDLFEEMKIASILQKYKQNDPTVLPATSMLEMITINGAKAQGRIGGLIEDGVSADLAMINLDSPRHTPHTNISTNLVYSATGADVELTMCQGKVLYEKGEFTTIDIEKIKHEATKIANKLI